MADLLSVRGLSRAFRDRIVVRGVDLTVQPGERLALRGPNGSGKSTILRCVIGTLAPTEGSVTIDGAPSGTRRARTLVGATLSQERSFYLRLSGRENLMLYGRLRHRDAQRAAADVEALVEELELHEIVARRVDRCSTGMVQQLGLARALIGAPRLLVLDEPTRSLDDAAAERLWGAIERRPDVGVVIATHRGADADRCTAQLVLDA